MPSRSARFLRLVAVAALVACGVAAAALGWRARQAESRVAALERELAEARGAIAEQRAARDGLEAEVAALRAALDAKPAAIDAPRETQIAREAPTDAREADAIEPADPHAGALPTVAATGLDVDRLVAVGFRRDDALRLRARVDEIDLARLDLHDRAMREGWAATPRFTQENRALNEEFAGLRGEFGDELYDWLLYSTGQPNRVAIGAVIEGGAGEAAGLARGDVILRYDDRLVLDALELRNLTFAGRAGELVAIEVLREGETAPLRYFVPRGPIGVRLAPTVGQPLGSG